MIDRRSSSEGARASSRRTSGAIEFRRPRRRQLLWLLPIAACCGAVAVRQWVGQGTLSLTVPEAIAIASDHNQTVSNRKLAVNALRRSAVEAIEALIDVAKQGDAAGIEAQVSLAHIRHALEGR